jgi:hypothetical protein
MSRTATVSPKVKNFIVERGRDYLSDSYHYTILYLYIEWFQTFGTTKQQTLTRPSKTQSRKRRHLELEKLQIALASATVCTEVYR